MRNSLSFIVLFLCASPLFSQEFPEKELKKKLKADQIEMDRGNGDGVFKARNSKTKKWGMFQYMYTGTEVKELIPMNYDSLEYIPFNGAFTIVFQHGKAGIYLSQWSYGDDAKETVPCQYDEFQRFTAKDILYLAAKRNGVWGWVDWYTGEEKSEFKYATTDDLPYPYFKQEN